MKKIFLAFLFGTIAFVPQAADACTIPVFRFALEKWDLTTYEILVYHRGPLSAEMQSAIKHWSSPPAKANVEITTIDLAGKLTKSQQKYWTDGGNKDAECWIILPSLNEDAGTPIAWSGPGNEANLRGIVSSPVRQALVAHLSRGASVVYVMLTSKDRRADEAVFDMLAKKLPTLEKDIKLPVQSDDAGSKLRLPLPLKLSLPLLVLDREDARESALIRLLLATEDGMDKVEGPIVFPIFGRGRVLGAIYKPEQGKNEKPTTFPANQVEEATMFLCKECSCMVKELNPGTDILLAANWPHIFDEMFEGKQAVPMPTALFATLPKRLTPTIELAPLPPAPETPIVPTPEPKASPTIEAAPTPTASAFNCPLCENKLWFAAGVAGFLVLASGAWLLYRMWA